jgi:hypothetical protein
MTTPPLSAAAQAVLDATEQVPVPHGQAFPLIRLEIAAAICALVEATVPENPRRYETFANEMVRLNRMGIRADMLAIAAELAGGAGQHTTQPTEITNEHA